MKRAALALVLLLAMPAHAAPRCDLGLILAMDVTTSVSPEEWEMQRSGLAQAIAAQPQWPQTTVIVVQWAFQQRITIEPTLVASRADAAALAAQIAVMPRAFDGHTKLAQAMEFLVDLADEMPCERKVIDVHGDGQDYPPPGQPVRARERAFLLGITVNALAIESSESYAHPGYARLADYYQAQLVTPDGFVIDAEGHGDFARAIKQKLSLEIAGARPEPTRVAEAR